MLDKLDAIYKRYLEVESLLSSSQAMSDMNAYVKLSKEYKDLEPNDSKLFIYKRWDEKNLFLIAHNFSDNYEQLKIDF